MKCGKGLRDRGGRNIQITENKAVKEFSDYVRMIDGVKPRQTRDDETKLNHETKTRSTMLMTMMRKSLSCSMS